MRDPRKPLEARKQSPADFAFAESYFAKVQRLSLYFRHNPHHKEILEAGVAHVIKFCKSYPSLAYLLASKDSLKSKLSTIFEQILLIEDKLLEENDLLSYYLHKEHDFIMKFSTGNYVISLFAFLLLVKEFFEFLEHLAALEALAAFEKETAAGAHDELVFKGYKFKGFSYDYFLAVKVLVSRAIMQLGESAVLSRLTERGLDAYLHEHFNFNAIKRLFSFKPDTETPKFLVKNLKSFSILKPQFLTADPEIEALRSHEMFSIDKILLNLSNQNTSEKLLPDHLDQRLCTPSEEQQEQLNHMFARKLLEHPTIQKYCLDLLKDNLRFFTFTTVEGKHKLSIFHKDYCTKRVQSLNPKKASFRLLHRILKTYDKKFIILEQLHINTRQNFLEYLRDYLYKGCAVPEEKFMNESEAVKKLNRKWNKAFLKVSEMVAESFLSLYTTMIFEEALRKSFLEEAQDIFTEVKETLFVHNVPLSLKINSLPNSDRTVSVLGKEKIVFVTLDKNESAVHCAFFKGLKLKKEVRLAVTRIDHSLKLIEFSDESLGSLFADFSPICAVIIANSKESYYLKNKIGLLVTKTASELKALTLQTPPFVYFYNERLAETLCSTNELSETGSGGSNTEHYNLLIQSPLFATLRLFSPKMLEAQNPLFKSGKTILEKDFILFLIKTAIKECLCENGICCSDLFNPDIGPVLQKLIGISTAEEEDEFKKALRDNTKEALYRSPVLNSNLKALLSFLKFDTSNGELMDFNTMKVPISKPHEYLSIINHLTSLSFNDIISLRDNATRVLYKSSIEDCSKDVAFLEQVIGKDSFLAKVVFMKNAINDMFPKLNPKFQNLQRKSISASFEEKLLSKLFEFEKHNIKPGRIVDFKIKDIDLKIIRGKVGDCFSGLIMIESIGCKNRIKIQEGELDRFFSKNEVIKGVVKKVFPSILRVDISISDQDLSNVRNYISKFSILKNYGLENNINFLIDNEKDVPSAPSFVLHERNFDFIDFAHPKVQNINLREAKNVLRDGKKADFLMKPSPRTQKSTIDLILFFPSKEIFDILPIKCNVSHADASGVITLATEQDSDPEKMTFTYDKFTFQGISEFISKFIEILTYNLIAVYNDRNFTTSQKSAISDYLKNQSTQLSTEMDIETANASKSLSYYITKASFKSLFFKLWYLDKNGETSFKMLEVFHEGFIFDSQIYVTLKTLFRDLELKRLQDDFASAVNDEATSKKSFLTEIIDSTPCLSIVSENAQEIYANNEQTGPRDKELGNNKSFNVARKAPNNFSADGPHTTRKNVDHQNPTSHYSRNTPKNVAWGDNRQNNDPSKNYNSTAVEANWGNISNVDMPVEATITDTWGSKPLNQAFSNNDPSLAKPSTDAGWGNNKASESLDWGTANTNNINSASNNLCSWGSNQDKQSNNACSWGSNQENQKPQSNAIDWDSKNNDNAPTSNYNNNNSFRNSNTGFNGQDQRRDSFNDRRGRFQEGDRNSGNTRNGFNDAHASTAENQGFNNSSGTGRRQHWGQIKDGAQTQLGDSRGQGRGRGFRDNQGSRGFNSRGDGNRRRNDYANSNSGNGFGDSSNNPQGFGGNSNQVAPSQETNMPSWGAISSNNNVNLNSWSENKDANDAANSWGNTAAPKTSNNEIASWGNPSNSLPSEKVSPPIIANSQAPAQNFSSWGAPSESNQNKQDENISWGNSSSQVDNKAPPSQQFIETSSAWGVSNPQAQPDTTIDWGNNNNSDVQHSWQADASKKNDFSGSSNNLQSSWNCSQTPGDSFRQHHNSNNFGGDAFNRPEQRHRGFDENNRTGQNSTRGFNNRGDRGRGRNENFSGFNPRNNRESDDATGKANQFSYNNDASNSGFSNPDGQRRGGFGGNRGGGRDQRGRGERGFRGRGDGFRGSREFGNNRDRTNFYAQNDTSQKASFNDPVPSSVSNGWGNNVIDMSSNAQWGTGSWDNPTSSVSNTQNNGWAVEPTKPNETSWASNAFDKPPQPTESFAPNANGWNVEPIKTNETGWASKTFDKQPQATEPLAPNAHGWNMPEFALDQPGKRSIDDFQTAPKEAVEPVQGHKKTKEDESPANNQEIPESLCQNASGNMSRVPPDPSENNGFNEDRNILQEHA